MTSIEKEPRHDGGHDDDSAEVKLSDKFLRLIELVESLPENQTGSDKTWVEVHLREAKEHFEKARRIR